MADTNKIFKRLQDHAETPPPGLYAKLWQKIKSLSHPDKALLRMILANTETAKRTSLTAAEQAFAALQSYTDQENPPPPFDLQKIKDTLADSKPQSTASQKPAALRWLYRAAAAAIIVSGIVLVYVNMRTAKMITTSTGKQNPLADTVKTVPVAVIKDSIAAVAKTQIPVNIQKKIIISSKQSNPVQLAASDNANNTNIINNDFLYTLTNFTIHEANDFFDGLKKDKKVVANNYVYVNVSDKMAAFLKQSYAVNRRNKYTWKARRMRAKLSRWKKADEQYFDNETGKDPLDINDLSEFLLKNKQ